MYTHIYKLTIICPNDFRITKVIYAGLNNVVIMHRFKILLQYQHKTLNQSTSRRRVLYLVECLYCNNSLIYAYNIQVGPFSFVPFIL